MTRKLIHRLITGLLMAAWPGAGLIAQSSGSGPVFDSLFRRGIDEAGVRPVLARECLSKMEAMGSPLSPPRQAKVDYLRLRLFNADPEKVKALDAKMYTAPDSIGRYPGMVWSAKKYLEKSMPDKAIPLLMEAIGHYGESDSATLCHIYLCEAYREKQEYLKGTEMLNGILYGEKAVSDVNRAFACNRLAAIYNEWGNPPASYTDSVFRFSEQCISISERIGSLSNLAFSQNELSFQYLIRKEYSKALELSVKAVSNFRKAGLRYSVMSSLINQSNIYIGMEEYSHALLSATEATRLSTIEENRNLYMRLYFELSMVYEFLGQYKDALDCLNVGRFLQVDFFRDRMDLQINEQSARYNLIIKEQKFREEEQKNEFHKKQIAFLIISLIILFVAFIITIFYLRARRQEFIKQKLIEAVAETEASERKRIASDLHDGLGPVLSAINLYFQAYVDARPKDREPIRIKIQEVISGAIDDVSRISHNISPRVLENHGLHTALKNFIATLDISDRIRVDYRADFTGRFERTKELTVYRSITELFNNTLKHAEASHIGLTISGTDKQLLITYTDNGIGFRENTENSEGMGLYSIRNRAEAFGGQVTIENQPDKGIRAVILIPF